MLTCAFIYLNRAIAIWYYKLAEFLFTWKKTIVYILYFDVVIFDLLDASAYESNLGRNRYEKGTFYLHNQGNANGQSNVIY